MADEFLYSGKKLSKIKNKIHNLGTHLGWFEEKIDHTINKLDKEIKDKISCSDKRRSVSPTCTVRDDDINGDDVLYFDSGISPLKKQSYPNDTPTTINDLDNSVSSMNGINGEYGHEKAKSVNNDADDLEQSYSSNDNDDDNELYQSLNNGIDGNDDDANSDDSNELYHSLSDDNEEHKDCSSSEDKAYLNADEINNVNHECAASNNNDNQDEHNCCSDDIKQGSSIHDCKRGNNVYHSLTDDNDDNHQDDDDDNHQAQSLEDDGSFKKSSDKSPLSFTHKSLRERVLRKYNPENSTGSDSDDLDSFLDRIRTPKQPTWNNSPELINDDDDDFIVDDECFIEEEENDYNDVFVIDDDSDEDKENFKTPGQKFKTPIACTPSVSYKTPFTGKKTKPSAGQTDRTKRPVSAIDSIITPYSTQKEFKKNREAVVKELFQLYNSTIFENKLPSDFSITWNNKMRTTAGFCYYGKKNGVTTARIELADKVIDSALRLRDTLVHEMCHAAAWLINGIRAGHGPVWKKWAQRANFTHHDLPPISRCHSYKINAKFTYRCTNEFCSNSIGRHSKSLDLEKYRCSYCHSRFELQPQLKKDGTPQSARTPNKFALFVKDNYNKVKITGMAHKDVMKELSSQFSSLSTK